MLFSTMFALAFSADPTEKAQTARWMAKALTWGALSTISTRSLGATVGDAFANPYSFAASPTGEPYFYVSLLDASMADAFTAKPANPRGE